MPSSIGRRLPQKPIEPRSFAAGVALVLLALPSAAQQAVVRPLSETEAVRMALERAAIADVVEGSIGLVQGDSVEAGLWPNPEISYSREQTDGSPSASTEDYLTLSQTFDLAGRRRLQKRAASRRVGRAALEAEVLRRDLAAETRLRFFEVLALQDRVALARRWSERMERLAGTVARREAAGDASGYDRRRLAREHATAVARLVLEEAGLERTRERLRALIGADAASGSAAPVVSGVLLPAEPVPPLDDLLTALSSRPEIQALDEEIAASRLERTAAERWWLPDLTLGGGYKHVALPGESLSGFLLSASVPLPLLDRSQGKALRAESRRRLAVGRRALELERLDGEVRGLWHEASRLADAARVYRSEVDGQTLPRIAETAYEGGEVGVLELVDAHRGATDADTLALDLEAAARRARIELDRLAGGGPR